MLNLTSNWAEDRALLGSNPSADPGAETGDGGEHFAPFSFLDLRDWQQSDKSRGSGGWPPVKETLFLPLLFTH